MTAYMAFLRGINVGWNNIIKMESLRNAFEEMGFSSVRTYIQSWNVLFKSQLEDIATLEKDIEAWLSEKFNYSARALVRSRNEMESIVLHFPKIFENDEWRHNVIFLYKNIDSEEILTRFKLKEDIEQVHYYKWVLYWSAKKDEITKTAMVKLASQKEYKDMTIRNINTTKAILELMRSEENNL